jgi:hypothetical protein
VTLTLLALFAAAMAVVAAACAALWLDRRRWGGIAWLWAVAVWSLATPALLALAGAPVARLMQAPLRGSAIPEAWGVPGLALALIVVAAVLPIGVVVCSRAVEGPADGAVFGGVVGVGLAVGASWLVLALTAWRPDAAALAFVVVLHAAAGALLGAGLGFGKLASRRTLCFSVAVAAAFAAAAFIAVVVVAALSCWQAWGEANIAGNLGLTAVALAALAAVLAACLAYERRLVSKQLQDEVELGVLPAWVVEVLPSYRRRIRSDWWSRRDERREIVSLLVTLAFRKHQLRTLSEDRLRLYGLEVGRLRQRARALLAPAPDRPAVASGNG